MRKHLLNASAIAGFLFLAAPAFANCDNHSPGNGTTVTCSGTDTTGIDGSGFPNITVNVQPGANITPSVAATDAVVVGLGTINVGASSVISSTNGLGIHANGTSGSSTVTMDTGSLINGGGTGIYLDSAGDITVGDGATVTGGGGTAIRTSAIDSSVTSIVRITDTSVINGNIVSGANANDEFHFVDNSGGVTFDTDDIGVKYQNFEKFYKDGATATLLTGTTSADWYITSGTLVADAVNINNAVLSNGAQLFLNGTGTIGGDISGTGNIVKSGSGTLTLTGTNTYTDGATIDDGVLAGDTNSISGTVNDNSTLQITGGTFANFVTGTGGILVDGDTIVLDGNNDFTGAVALINGAGLTLNAASAIASASGVSLDATSNFGFGDDMDTNRDFNVATGSKIFANNHTDIISGIISGGRLTLDGPGFLTITGNNTYTGGTSILDGVLTGTTSSIRGDILDNSYLIFDQGTNGDYTGIISGNGQIGKFGTSRVNFTNTSTFTGLTNVFAGTLAVNGSMASSSIDVGGGTLGGTGTVGATRILANGHLAPGNSIGTLHVNGTLQINGSSSYDVEYSGTGADNTIASGNITINNASTTLNLIGVRDVYQPSSTYTILSSTGGTVTGAFSTVTNNFAFLDDTIIYNSNNVQLQLTRNNTAFSSVASDDGQRNTANAVQQLGIGNDLFEVFSFLTVDQARTALDDLSGEHNAGIAGAMVQSSSVVQNVLMTHMNSISYADSSGNQSALAFNTPTSVEPAAGESLSSSAWIEGIGTFGSSDAQGSTPKQDRSSYGALAGYDFDLEEESAGVFAGYERSEIDTDSEAASSDLNNYHFGVYATRPVTGGFHISGALGGTYHDINTQRYVVFPGFSAAPEGDTDGYTASGFAEISKPLSNELLAIEPFFNISMTHSHMNGYTETNGGSADLVVDNVDVDNPATAIGTRVGKNFQTDTGQDIKLNVSLGWQHNYGDLDDEGQMRFAAGTVTFDSYGVPRDRNAGVVGLNIGTEIQDGLSAFAGYDGTLSQDSQDHSFKAGLKWDF